CRSASIVGSPPPGWATRYTGPLSASGSSGVAADTVPTSDSGAHPAGSAWNVASGHAAAAVLERAASSLGNCTETDLTLDCSSGCVIVTFSPAPFAADVLPSAVAVRTGVNGSSSQPVAPVGVTASLVTNCPGASYESADKVVVCGPIHA